MQATAGSVNSHEPRRMYIACSSTPPDMERFLKSSPQRSGLPPDLAAMLTTENARLPDRPQSMVISDQARTSLPKSAVQQESSVIVPQPATASSTPTPPPIARFRPVNAGVTKHRSSKKAPRSSTPSKLAKSLAPLAPAPSRQQQLLSRHQAPAQQHPSQAHEKGFLGLPAELRVEIYKLVLDKVTVHILPQESGPERRAPHPLTRINQLIRAEVLPIIHERCPIEAIITDFNFSGMLEFMSRIPPKYENFLLKNDNLKIQLCTTGDKSKGVQWNVSDSLSLGRWLRYRADKHRLQPRWKYCGVWPGSKVESAIRRKINRMTEDGKKQELIKLGTAIGMSRLVKQPKDGEDAS